MGRLIHSLYVALVVGLVGVSLLAACGGEASAPPTPAAVEQADNQSEETEHEDNEAEHGEDSEDEHVEESEHSNEAEHENGDTHGPDEHMSAEGHDVPEEAAAVPNLIEADDESVEIGAELYASNCATCHGESGEGDGPASAALETKPADLHESHVQDLSDGALFYIVSHGRPDTPMPAWDNVLSEEERWHVVNFLRTFR